MELDLAQVIQQAKTGSEQALSLLLDLYQPMIESAAAYYYPGLSSAGYTAEDLKQEASMALFKAVEGYDETYNVTFGAYAKRCVRNRLVSIYRSACSKKKKSVQNLSINAHPPAVGQEGEGQDRRKARIEALEITLTDYERDVWSFYSQGYKPAEIAKTMGREVKSVYNAICRIKAKASKI